MAVLDVFNEYNYNFLGVVTYTDLESDTTITTRILQKMLTPLRGGMALLVKCAGTTPTPTEWLSSALIINNYDTDGHNLYSELSDSERFKNYTMVAGNDLVVTYANSSGKSYAYHLESFADFPTFGGVMMADKPFQVLIEDVEKHPINRNYRHLTSGSQMYFIVNNTRWNDTSAVPINELTEFFNKYRNIYKKTKITFSNEQQRSDIVYLSNSASSFVGLTDVSYPTPPTSGFVPYYNSVTQKFEEAPEIKINPISRAITIESADNVDITGNVFLRGYADNIILDNNNVNGGSIVLRPSEFANSRCYISVMNKTSDQYALDIANEDSCIPNVAFVKSYVESSVGLSSTIYEYQTDTTGTAPPPSAGDIIYNNATQTSSTSLYLSHLTFGGTDVENFLSLVSVGTKLSIQEHNVSGNYQNFTISSAPIVSAGSYVEFPVTYNTSGGSGATGFANNLKVIVVFTSGSGVPATPSTYYGDVYNYIYSSTPPTASSSGGSLNYNGTNNIRLTMADADGNHLKQFYNTAFVTPFIHNYVTIRKRNDRKVFKKFIQLTSADLAQSAPDPAGYVEFAVQEGAGNGTFSDGDLIEFELSSLTQFIFNSGDLDQTGLADRNMLYFDSATSKWKLDTILPASKLLVGETDSQTLTNKEIQSCTILGSTQFNNSPDNFVMPVGQGTAGQVIRSVGGGTGLTTWADQYFTSLTTTGTGGTSTLTSGVLNIPQYQSGISLTTTGTDGASSFISNTLNVPQYQGQITLSTSGTTGASTFSSNTLTIPTYQGQLTLTTTGSSGASTLVGNTLNIPQYSGGGGSVSAIFADPYPLCKIGANITPATTAYYFNATSRFTGTATAIRFMLGVGSSSDNFRLGIYRANSAWDIASATLIGQTAITLSTPLGADQVHSLNLVAEAGQNLNLTAGEGIILCCYSDGTTLYWKGSTQTSSTQAWQNTTNLTAVTFPVNPQTKATNSGTIPMLELVGTH